MESFNNLQGHIGTSHDQLRSGSKTIFSVQSLLQSSSAKTILSSLFTVTKGPFCHIPPTLIQASMPFQASSTTTVKKRQEDRSYPPSPRVEIIDEYESQREKWCDELLTLDGCKEDVGGLVGRGETLLVKEEFEEAIHQRLQRAQKLLKQSKQKDYYQILDVSRDADAKTIKKAFRKQAKNTYEVLSNPELRQRFDNREDPMDPMSQQGPGGHPFANGQHPFVQFFQQAGLGGRGFAGGQGGF
ncbi:hypothetical protein CPC08DRAFT_769925 [Agrocybe pediades]|nr:hypothetical protein CPC08DRAFT_769925 [Agrocybe pediades]